jgi:putative ABC transport system ATP-binding protein
MSVATTTERDGHGAKTAVPVVRAEGLCKTYGEGATAVHALDEVTFEIPHGEFVVMLGPSGSGKTTMLNVVGALDSPTGGSLEVMGLVRRDMDEAAQTRFRLDTVGFVFQFFNLVPTLTALENVALLAELTGEHAETRARDVLDEVGLADRVDHFPGQLSGGEQQRVSIARALVKRPPLLLCDEPTGALDIDTGRRVLRVLRDTTDQARRSVLLVTHNSVIAQMADRVFRLLDGKLVSDETNPDPLAPEELQW